MIVIIVSTTQQFNGFTELLLPRGDPYFVLDLYWLEQVTGRDGRAKVVLVHTYEGGRLVTSPLESVEVRFRGLKVWWDTGDRDDFREISSEFLLRVGFLQLGGDNSSSDSRFLMVVRCLSSCSFMIRPWGQRNQARGALTVTLVSLLLLLTLFLLFLIKVSDRDSFYIVKLIILKSTVYHLWDSSSWLPSGQNSYSFP